jgi:uncharacterized membrane protein
MVLRKSSAKPKMWSLGENERALGFIPSIIIVSSDISPSIFSKASANIVAASLAIIAMLSFLFITSFLGVSAVNQSK